MKNKIERLQISNYKSIENMDITCKRINIFIGKPNVGKSNILEAISLLNIYNSSNSNYLGTSSIRYEQLGNLFHYNNLKFPIKIESSIGHCIINHIYHVDRFIYRAFPKNFDIDKLLETDDTSQTIQSIINSFNKDVANPFFENRNNKKTSDDWQLIQPVFCSIKRDGEYEGNPMHHTFHSPIRKYDFIRFNKKNLGNDRFYQYLRPPIGSNLLAILETQPELMQFSQEMFNEYNLELLIGKNENDSDSIEIQRKEGFYIYKIPYSSVADTLQRIIFHSAAIDSNKDSVLLFEEPEAHNFPPYIKTLGEKIVQDSKNQYFITTHSPFLLNTIIENTDLSELSVFKTGYESNKTTVAKIEADELLDMINYGQDIFFNL